MLAGPLFGLATGAPYWVGSLLTVPAVVLAVTVGRRAKAAP